ncbi:MAG: O-antigen ligase family protein [Bacteroidetes bacterium]|nr:O-antigen ligase family protein [Bacteroidota bacterium]
MKERAYFYLLSAFLFFLPSFQSVSVMCIAAMLLLWLFSGDAMVSFTVIKQDKKILFFLFFYMAHLVGLLYTANFSFAFFDLQSKLSFLLCPLLFPALIISKEQFTKLKLIFVSGCTAGALLCLFFSYRNYSANPSPHYFYYTYYSHFLHPSYFSMYLNLAIIFLADELIRKWDVLSHVKKIAGISLCYFLFVTIIQLSARTASVVAFVTVFVFLLYRFKQDVKWGRKYVISFLFLVSLFLVQFYLLNHVNRFNDVKSIIKEEPVQPAGNKIEEPIIENENSTGLHMKIWKYSIALGKRSPLIGVGTGDIKDELENIYRENNFNAGVAGRFNCHNQFLNTFVALGLIGLISLFLMYYPGLKISFKNRDWIYFFFLLIVILNSMTECLFEKQNGILFFAAFNILFYLRSQSDSASPKPDPAT